MEDTEQSTPTRGTWLCLEEGGEVIGYAVVLVTSESYVSVMFEDAAERGQVVDWQSMRADGWAVCPEPPACLGLFHRNGSLCLDSPEDKALAAGLFQLWHDSEVRRLKAGLAASEREGMIVQGQITDSYHDQALLLLKQRDEARAIVNRYRNAVDAAEEIEHESDDERIEAISTIAEESEAHLRALNAHQLREQVRTLERGTGAAKEPAGRLPTNPKTIMGAGKPDLSLVPPVAIAHMAMSFEDGGYKYGPYNWRESAVEARTYIAAGKRHFNDYLDGSDYATDSEVHNLGAVMACCAIILDATAQGNLIDDRPLPGASARVHEELKATKADFRARGIKQWGPKSVMNELSERAQKRREDQS